MAQRAPQARAPKEESRQRVGQSVFYPQVRVTVSVVFENFGDPKAPKSFPVLPRTVTVYSNSYKEADTFSVEFDSKDLPVSPELIRGGSVEIYFFQTPGLGRDNIAQVLKADDPATPEVEGLTPAIAGLFDEVGMEFSDSGRSLTIDGVDYTSLFIAKQWIPKKSTTSEGTSVRASGNGTGRIPTGRPLDEVLLKLIREVDGAKATRLKVEGVDLNGNDISGNMPIVGSAEGKGNRKKGIPVKSGQNYWDVMYSLAVRYGFIIFVRGLDVILTTPQAYVANRSKARKMAWGRNLLSLRVSRRIGKVQVPVVEVRSYDDKRRKVIKARYPKSKKQVPVTGLGTKRDETRIFNVPNIKSEKQLARVAESVYNLTARSEQTVEIETMDLRDLEGTDLLELRAGDALSIGFDPFNQSSVLIEGQNDGQRQQTLVNLGYSPAVAREISQSFDAINLFKRPFRVKEATFEWSYDGGLSISAQLQNFVNIEDQGVGDTAP
jgi:hypothetical protein